MQRIEIRARISPMVNDYLKTVAFNKGVSKNVLITEIVNDWIKRSVN